MHLPYMLPALILHTTHSAHSFHIVYTHIHLPCTPHMHLPHFPLHTHFYHLSHRSHNAVFELHVNVLREVQKRCHRQLHYGNTKQEATGRSGYTEMRISQTSEADWLLPKAGARVTTSVGRGGSWVPLWTSDDLHSTLYLLSATVACHQFPPLCPW